MADRRMFSKTIIDSDQFLDMPLSTQSLYFHLSMRADDEGFVNNPRKVQRMIGASDDDFKVLITKNFIIPFESGIVVIKHWRIHNYIRADRLVPTTCKAEKACLETVDDGVYELCEEAKEIELLDATDVRKAAYKQSTLPYSFSYKIKRAFEGLTCPICGRTMTSSYKTTMPTVQHNIPISKGGEHELGNISVICESCNTSIRDKETDALNNAKVIELWDKIIAADRAKIKWFDDPRMLDNLDVSQLAVKCLTSDGQMPAQVSIGKVSIDKDSVGKDNDRAKARFAPPTFEEVQAYCNERKNNIDPQYFIDYYAKGGWVLKNGHKMVDWKAAVRTWEKNDFNGGRKDGERKGDMAKAESKWAWVDHPI